MKNIQRTEKSIPLRGLIWVTFVLTLLLDIYAIVLLLPSLGEAQDLGWGFRGFPIIASLPFIIIGTLILNRHPNHMVGWLFSLIGLMSALQGLLQSYLIQVYWLSLGNSELGLIVAWVLQWAWLPIVYLIILIPYFFPDGRLPSPHWKFVLFIGSGTLILFALAMAFTPGLLENSMPSLKNPFALQGYGTFFEIAQMAGFFSLFGLFIGAAISLLQRFRRSEGQERQQIKWFLYATVLAALTAPAGMSVYFLGQLVFILALSFLPVATAIAILQYRLWDIDLVIRRTIVYAAITLLLAVIYSVSVIFFQFIFTTLTGQESPVSIVLSTLTIAAVFYPLRARVQVFIDRRFYRRRYDAERTLALFAQAARDEVNQEQLTQELLNAVQKTMQPQEISLWITTKSNEV